MEHFSGIAQPRAARVMHLRLLLDSDQGKIMASKPELSSGEQRPQLDRSKGNQK